MPLGITYLRDPELGPRIVVAKQGQYGAALDSVGLPYYVTVGNHDLFQSPSNGGWQGWKDGRRLVRAPKLCCVRQRDRLHSCRLKARPV